MAIETVTQALQRPKVLLFPQLNPLQQSARSISQDEIATLLAARNEAERFQKLAALLEISLAARIEAGAIVQDGPLRATLTGRARSRTVSIEAR